MVKKIAPALIVSIMLVTPISAHPGRTDSHGGHSVSSEGWGCEVGTYHFHDKYGNVIAAADASYAPCQISVVYDGKLLAFADQEPIIMNGRTLVPIYGVAESFGCQAQWDAATQSLYLTDSAYDAGGYNNRNMCGRRNSNGNGICVYVNGFQVSFDDQDVVNYNGRILVPIKYVAEKLGCVVNWDERLQTVYIESAE